MKFTENEVDKSVGICVLHVIPNFYPATKWGGPIFSTKAICDSVAGFPGVKLSVVTTDAAGPNLQDTLFLTDRIARMPAGYLVTYFRRVLASSISPGLMAALPRAIKSADVVHLTSAYSSPVLPTLAVARILGKPVIWSPRGALQAAAEWEDAPRKRSKRAFEWFARKLARRDTVLHVTAQSEAAATSRRMPGFRTVTIPNSVEIPAVEVTLQREWRPDGRLRLVFLSRLHPKKGLEILFESIANSLQNIELDIYGTGDADYIKTLSAKLTKLGIDQRVRFKGHVDGECKIRAFRSADLFVLPSYSENFGIVVAEALAHGVPVLTTDATPWARLSEKGCGKCIPLNVEALTIAIAELAQNDLRKMGLQGRTWMEEQFSQERIGAAMLKLYREVREPSLSGGLGASA